jgi:LysW-gamma-L-lysine/LysW-L-ornithine aminotransferase
MNFKEKEELFEAPIYPKIPISIVKGSGVHLWDCEGNRYLDFMSGQGTANVGNCNEDVVRAVREQMEKIISCYNPMYSPVRAEFLEKVVSVSPGNMTRAYLCNSGTESVEAALKFVRYTTKRKGFVAFENCFHGRTMGSLSATWKRSYRVPFEPLVGGFVHAPFNNAEMINDFVTRETAGVIVELVQGEGGVVPADREFVKALKEVCVQKGVLLIVDEIQTGFGRTGKMFASQHYGVEPDVVCMGKSIAGGLPMGATVFNENVKLDKKIHGTTFGGNPVVCAAGLAAINFIEKKDLIENARVVGAHFLQKLKGVDSQKINEVRGIGLMLGVELNEKPGRFLRLLAEKGVLVLPAGERVMRFLPPLIVSKKDVDFVVEKVVQVLESG